LAGLAVLRGDARSLYDQLVSGQALSAVIVSALAGLATLVLVYRRRFEPARYSAAVAVAAVAAGWALGQWPTILPGLDIREAAAPHDTLVAVVVAVLGGGAIVFPSLALLFRLTLAGQLDAGEPRAAELHIATGRRARARTALLARTAIACLIVGFGLLTLADAGWAHAVGVAALFAFMITAFLALMPGALPEEPPAAGDSSRNPARPDGSHQPRG
jgi:cytochrome d ubiquinol oxidase subunit II